MSLGSRHIGEMIPKTYCFPSRSHFATFPGAVVTSDLSLRPPSERIGVGIWYHYLSLTSLVKIKACDDLLLEGKALSAKVILDSMQLHVNSVGGQDLR